MLSYARHSLRPDRVNPPRSRLHWPPLRDSEDRRRASYVWAQALVAPMALLLEGATSTCFPYALVLSALQRVDLPTQ